MLKTAKSHVNHHPEAACCFMIIDFILIWHWASGRSEQQVSRHYECLDNMLLDFHKTVKPITVDRTVHEWRVRLLLYPLFTSETPLSKLNVAKCYNKIHSKALLHMSRRNFMLQTTNCKLFCRVSRKGYNWTWVIGLWM